MYRMRIVQTSPDGIVTSRDVYPVSEKWRARYNVETAITIARKCRCTYDRATREYVDTEGGRVSYSIVKSAS